MRVKLKVAYEGTLYKGWQSQTYTPHTIQHNLEQSLSNVCNHNVIVHASGRTDVGVHALGQVVHFDTTAKRSMHALLSGCNHYLPTTIRVLDAIQVADDFHARYNAKSKTYQYWITMDLHPLMVDRAMYCPELNVSLMREACTYVVGQHDFGSFVGSGSIKYHTTVRNCMQCDIDTTICPITGCQLVVLSITAKGFLYKMVRLIVGLMVRIAKEELPIDAFRSAIITIDRKYTTLLAPACGLYLATVEY
ncbi:MAG: tRNA pseudouridine(38-40) synthase TruA [Clostridiales bacterium]|nr:tRNA pseudouridine(38-40) synthase TruA [Clostridiales bacterium]